MFDGLDINEPVVIKLADKYQVPTTVIAYLRAALMRADHRYDKESLTYHIIEENSERKKEIALLKVSITEENIEQRKEQILAIQKKMDFRQGVLAILRNIDDQHLRDILQIA